MTRILSLVVVLVLCAGCVAVQGDVQAVPCDDGSETCSNS